MSPLVYIYADESCLGNQFSDRENPGGAAGLVEHWREDRWVRKDYWISEPGTTNNRMAIRSALEGLISLKRPCRVVFTSDSQYLVRGMRDWVPGWIRQGWKRRTGVLENVELWRELVTAASPHQVDWRWVRGHAGHPQNEYANWLATRAAKVQTRSDGLVDSEFEAWIEQQREKGRYLEFPEFAPPDPTDPRPGPGVEKEGG